MPNPDFIVPIEIDGMIHHVYVLKRPHVDLFLQRVGELFEVVLFTASLSKVGVVVCVCVLGGGTMRDARTATNRCRLPAPAIVATHQ